jgi:hypothetical protein
MAAGVLTLSSSPGSAEIEATVVDSSHPSSQRLFVLRAPSLAHDLRNCGQDAMAE